jgi:hypothetical protein
MENLHGPFVIFVAVLVGLFCWWGGSTASCGVKTNRKTSAKDSRRRRRSKTDQIHLHPAIYIPIILYKKGEELLLDNYH